MRIRRVFFLRSSRLPLAWGSKRPTAWQQQLGKCMGTVAAQLNNSSRKTAARTSPRAPMPSAPSPAPLPWHAPRHGSPPTSAAPTDVAFPTADGSRFDGDKHEGTVREGATWGYFVATAKGVGRGNLPTTTAALLSSLPEGTGGRRFHDVDEAMNAKSETHDTLGEIRSPALERRVSSADPPWESLQGYFSPDTYD